MYPAHLLYDKYTVKLISVATGSAIVVEIPNNSKLKYSLSLISHHSLG